MKLMKFSHEIHFESHDADFMKLTSISPYSKWNDNNEMQFHGLIIAQGGNDLLELHLLKHC